MKYKTKMLLAVACGTIGCIVVSALVFIFLFRHDAIMDKLHGGAERERAAAADLEASPRYTATKEEIARIKVAVEARKLDAGSGKSRLIVKVQNTSEKAFEGQIKVASSTNPTADSFIEPISKLLPAETKEIESAADVGADTYFIYHVEGNFSAARAKDGSSAYGEIVGLEPGAGYSTLFVFASEKDTASLIESARAFKAMYADRLELGFQVRFVSSRQSATEEQSFASYTYLRKSGFSRLIVFDPVTGKHTIVSDQI